MRKSILFVILLAGLQVQAFAYTDDYLQSQCYSLANRITHLEKMNKSTLKCYSKFSSAQILTLLLCQTIERDYESRKSLSKIIRILDDVSGLFCNRYEVAFKARDQAYRLYRHIS